MDQLTEWFAVQTKPRYERVASAIISEKGYPCFLPMYTETRKWSDRRKSLAKPLFPGYLFFRSRPESLGGVVATTGILRIVGYSGNAISIEESEIEAIQAAVDSGLNLEQHAYLEVGDRVRLESGPLAGLHGILSDRKNRCRFVVSVGLLRRSVSVEVDSRWLSPVAGVARGAHDQLVNSHLEGT